LGDLFGTVSAELQLTVILPVLTECLDDEEMLVRRRAYIALANGVTETQPAVRKKCATPLLALYTDQSAATHPTNVSGAAGGNARPSHRALAARTVHISAELVGKVAYKFRDIVTDQQRHEIFAFFYSLIAVTEPVESRQHAAFNLPAMLLVLARCPPEMAEADFATFAEWLELAVSALSQDPEPTVRRTVAAAYHELCNAAARLGGIGKEPRPKFYASGLLRLLRDADCAVAVAVSGHLAGSLAGLASFDNSASCSLSPETLTAIRQCYTTIGGDWRAKVGLLKTLSRLHEWFPPNQVFAKIAPCLSDIILVNDPRPQSLVQQAALRAMMLLLRSTRRQEQREYLLAWMVSELAEGRSAWSRMLFVDLCKHTMEIFSRAYFKDNLYEALLNLVRDPVAEVRIRLCRLAGKLKKVLTLPLDRPLLKLLETGFGRICNEHSNHALAAIASEAIAELDSISVDSIWGGTDSTDPEAVEDQRRLAVERATFSDDKDEKGLNKWRSGGSSGSKLPSPHNGSVERFSYTASFKGKSAGTLHTLHGNNKSRSSSSSGSGSGSGSGSNSSSGLVQTRSYPKIKQTGSASAPSISSHSSDSMLTLPHAPGHRSQNYTPSGSPRSARRASNGGGNKGNQPKRRNTDLPSSRSSSDSGTFTSKQSVYIQKARSLRRLSTLSKESTSVGGGCGSLESDEHHSSSREKDNAGLRSTDSPQTKRKVALLPTLASRRNVAVGGSDGADSRGVPPTGSAGVVGVAGGAYGDTKPVPKAVNIATANFSHLDLMQSYGTEIASALSSSTTTAVGAPSLAGSPSSDEVGAGTSLQSQSRTASHRGGGDGGGGGVNTLRSSASLSSHSSGSNLRVLPSIGTPDAPQSSARGSSRTASRN
jgi:hypothetical protein